MLCVAAHVCGRRSVLAADAQMLHDARYIPPVDEVLEVGGRRKVRGEGWEGGIGIGIGIGIGTGEGEGERGGASHIYCVLASHMKNPPPRGRYVICDTYEEPAPPARTHVTNPLPALSHTSP